jgi:hypothetical protein
MKSVKDGFKIFIDIPEDIGIEELIYKACIQIYYNSKEYFTDPEIL